MYTYQNLIEKCNAAIAAIEYPKSPQGLYEPIAYALSLGGKRIRPVFMLLSAQLFSKDAEAFMDAAVSIEMYHNYTLLHDDLMDNADVRRGKPTVHRRWDANTAILSGDAMLMEVYKRIFTAVTNQKALEASKDVIWLSTVSQNTRRRNRKQRTNRLLLGK